MRGHRNPANAACVRCVHESGHHRPIRALPAPVSRRRLLITLALIAAAATVVSVTVGRDLYQGRAPDIESFILLHFAGYLIFLIMPVDLLVPWYLAEGHGGGELLSLAVLTATLAHLIDYGIGRLLSEEVVEHVIGKRRLRKAYAHIERWGKWAIFVFCLLPLSSPSVVVASGIVRYGLLRTVVWSVAGLVGKYGAMVWLFGG